MSESPKDNYDFDSVDDILDNVHQFIEGVYRDLSVTLSSNATENSFAFRTPKRSSEPLNESSILSSTSSPVGAIGGALSPSSSNEYSHGSSANCSITSIRSPIRRNMDAEIERINRICEDVTESLRSNGISLSNSYDNENTAREENRSHSVNRICEHEISASNSYDNENTAGEENRSHSDISHVMSLPISSTTSIPTSTPNSSPIYRRPNMIDCVNQSRSIPVMSSQIIDLCENQTQTPEVLRQPFHLHNVHEDDDVILVSSITPVIDLCTPGHMEAPIRRTIAYGKLNRRRLAEPIEDIVPVKMPSTDPTPFMCAVCMETCLQRQPTSTKCGHVFCNECITEVLRLTRKCPLCNKKMSQNSLFRIYL